MKYIEGQVCDQQSFLSLLTVTVLGGSLCKINTILTVEVHAFMVHSVEGLR